MTTTRTKASVADVMTKNPVCVGAGEPASELARILEANEISGVPVVDAQNRVIGVASRTDLLHQCVAGPVSGVGTFFSALVDGFSGEFSSEDLGTVGDMMHDQPLVVAPEDSVVSAARRMASERVHRLIVVDPNRRVLGIVTSLDLLGAIGARS